MAAADVVLIRTNQPVSELGIHLRLCESVVDTQQTEDNVVSGQKWRLHLTGRRLLFQMIAHNRRIVLQLSHVLDGRLEELIHLFLRHLQSIQQLIMSRHHTSVKKVRLLLMLYHAEHRISTLQPLAQPAKLQILNAGRRSDQLDVLDRLRQRESVQLLDFRNPVVSKELLNVCVETAGLEKSVSEQQHAVLLVLGAKQGLVHQRLTVPDAVRNLNVLGARHQMTVFTHSGRDNVIRKRALKIIDYQKVLRPHLQRVHNRACRQRDIAFQSSEVNLLSRLYLNAAHLPLVHSGVETFVDVQTFADTRGTGRPLVTNIMDAVTIEALFVKLLADFSNTNLGGNVNLCFVLAVFQIEILAEYGRG